MTKHQLARAVLTSILVPFFLSAQVQNDPVPLKYWSAPMYWQPSRAEDQASRDKAEKLDKRNAANSAQDLTPQAQTPANSLVFVGMTPCRVVDTRPEQLFPAPFGAPNLVGGIPRTFPIQSSTKCSIPPIAQAYSLNVTVVPFGFLGYITVWPTGQPQPLASTLNDDIGTVLANAAVVPAGTNGSIDVFAFRDTHLVIDINGYYAPQTGITLAQGNAGAPSLSFAGDAGTGIFSSGPGIVNITAGGANRLQISNGNVGITTTNALVPSLQVVTPGEGIRIRGQGTGSPNTAWLSFYDNAATPIGYVGDGSGQDSSMYLSSYVQNVYLATQNGLLTTHQNGNVGVGTPTPQTKLDVRGDIGLGPSGEFRAASGSENLRMVRGTIRGDGVILAGAGFSVNHPCVGCTYTIAFNPAFLASPAVTASAVDLAGIAIVRTSTVSAATLDFFSKLDGTGQVDTTFHFIAIGPR